MDVLPIFFLYHWLGDAQSKIKYSMRSLSQSDALTVDVIWVLHWKLSNHLLLFSVISVLDTDIRSGDLA